MASLDYSDDSATGPRELVVWYTDTTQIMGRNAIQFQKGLSEPEFQKLYGTEAQCEDALAQMPWPKCVGPMAFVAHAAKATLMASFTDAGSGAISVGDAGTKRR